MKLSSANRYLFWFSITKIPIVAFVGPKIVEISDNHVLIKVRKRRRNVNHLKSIYVAALAVGADISSAFLAFLKTQKSDDRISLIFKSMSSEFHKRPMTDAYFLCENGSVIDGMITKSKETGLRQNELSEVLVYTDYYGEKELVATFKMEISIKVKT